MASKYPELVTKLINTCDVWIVGSAAESEQPRDYDVYVPLQNWPQACAMIPKEAKINSLGGFKAISNEKEVDVFTCDFSILLASSFFKVALHPRTNTLIKRQ